MTDPLDQFREPFEAMHLEYFPGINVTRKDELYTKQQVNNRWFIWLLAKGIPLPIDLVNPNQPLSTAPADEPWLEMPKEKAPN